MQIEQVFKDKAMGQEDLCFLATLSLRGMISLIFKCHLVCLHQHSLQNFITLPLRN